MSSPDQDSNADKVDGQVPAEDSQVPAEENPAPFGEEHDQHLQHQIDLSPIKLSDVESGLEEIGDSDGSNDEQAIFSAKLPNRGDFHHGYSSSNENDVERTFAELTPLQAVSIQSVELGQGSSSNENEVERTYAELTPLQAADYVLKPSDIIQSVEEFGEGTDDLNQHRYIKIKANHKIHDNYVH